MERRTRVDVEVSRLLGLCGLTRSALVQIMTFLHVLLPRRANTLRTVRDPADERQFLCSCDLFDDNGCHSFEFVVDDVTDPDRWWVVDARHTYRLFGG